MNQHLHTDPGGQSGIHEDLLVKHLLGETGPEESARVESWLAADPANRHYYEHFQLIWRESRRLGDDAGRTADQQGPGDQEEAAWQKFRQRIHRPSALQAVKDTPAAPERQLSPGRSIFSSWFRVAAILILVASVTAIVYLTRNNSATGEKTVASHTAVLNDTLPDGSLITLNKLSDISYPSTFRKERAVRLHGEAFFKIAPDKEKPFRVYSNGVTITVLGTAFNVRNKGTATEIIVESGLVRVTDSLHSVLLHPSEKLTLQKGDATLSKDSTRGQLYKYYRTKEFICDNTPLWQLAASLEEAYNVRIIIESPQVREQKINTTFRDASLDQILSVIQETFRIHVTRSGDQITLQK